ncbi:MAG: hypothetical protein GXO43_04290 [Crenarchaeota archaeon]|nr:hypothetical protein [Thermoproteota archaeon]
MVRLSYILKKYDMIEKDLEYEIYFDNGVAIVCGPDYRTNLDATTEVRCNSIDDINNGIIKPFWYDSILDLFWDFRNRKIRKIVISRDGKPIKMYYNVTNDLKW